MRLLFFLVYLCALHSAAIAAETEWFSIAIPSGWTTVNDNDDVVVVADASGSQRFKVSVNKKNNEFLMCFCAPMDKYSMSTVNGFTIARLEQFGTVTLKVRGDKFSTDVHYSLQKNKNDAENITVIESIRPK